MTRRAGLYCRISLDRDGKAEGVERQREDGHSLADRVGVQVVDEYLDNDVSAFDKRKRRPEFERMLQDLDSGRIDTIIVWRSDRLARQPRDLERVIDVLERSGGQLLSVTEPEFSGATGLLVLRMLGAFASHESQVKSERVTRKNQALAEAGKWKGGGTRPFGYHADGLVNASEAVAYVHAVDSILGGVRASTVVADWNHRGLTTVTGKRWTLSGFTRMMRSPRPAGIVVYRGERLDVHARWEPIIDKGVWEALQRVLEGRRNDPARRRVRRHPLTGLAHCGSCGKPMGATSRGQEWVEYRCNPDQGGCGRVSMRAARLEPVVLERFLHVVTTPEFKLLVEQAQGQNQEVAEAMAALREDEAALEQLGKDHYVDRSVPRPQYLSLKAQLEKRIRAGQATIQRASSQLLAMPHDVETLRAEWETRSPEWRRSVLEAVVEKVVVRPGGRWDQDRVTVVWKA